MVNETVNLNVSSNLFNETLTGPLPITSHEQSLLIGFSSMIVACILHGFSSIYFEKVLKESNIPIWLGGAQANIFVIIIGSVAMIVKDHEEILNAGLFQGFDEIVWSVILMRGII
jgi:UDP-sugar transporter A1/2/3